MAANQPFLDSNVICYLFGSDPAKAARARAALTAHPAISTQVLAEVCHVASRKAKLSWAEIEEVVALVSALCDIVPLTAAIQAAARGIAAATGYTIFDAQIVAAAIEHGCTMVWSEDMQHERVVASRDGQTMLIRSPFEDEQ